MHWGLGFRGLGGLGGLGGLRGFRIQGSGFRVQGLGVRVQGSGFWDLSGDLFDISLGASEGFVYFFFFLDGGSRKHSFTYLFYISL